MIRYYIKSAIESLLKNSLMSIASIVTVASCVLVFIIAFCISINIDYYLKHLESSFGMTIFFDDTIPESDVNRLLHRTSLINGIKSVQYVDKNKALEIAKESFKENKDILEGLRDDNPLPRSIEISINTINDQSTIVSKLDKMIYDYYDYLIEIKPDIDIDNAIKISSTNIKPIISLNNAIRIVSSVVTLLMSMISVVIITNTIKLTVNNRKTEINIMKYVGATDWFIKWPFIIEGVLIGFLGTIISIIIGYLSYSKLVGASFVNEPILKFLNLSSVFILTNDIFIYLAPLSLFIGIFIGVIGSSTSIKKYLQV